MHFIKHLLSGATLALGMAFVSIGSAIAAQQAPDELVLQVTREVIQEAAQNSEIKSGDRRKIRELVEKKILPHVDFEHMTAITAGRHWRTASPEQKQLLTQEFSSLLIHTYSGALSLASSRRIDLRVQRARVDASEAEVQMQILQGSGAEPIQVGYRLHMTPEGWQVYDISVMGAWLVDSYKGNFNAEIGRTGVDGLILALSQRNKKLKQTA